MSHSFLGAGLALRLLNPTGSRNFWPWVAGQRALVYRAMMGVSAAAVPEWRRGVLGVLSESLGNYLSN